jgi:hypothetical protein
LAIFLIFILIISGCKGECEVSSDCPSQTCKTASCIGKKCQYETIEDCCGNGICEDTENKCTCARDCGTCSGKGKVKIGSRTYDTEYLEYLCENNECVLGVEEDKAKEMSLLDENNFGYFKLETLVTFNKPFDTRKDSFNFRITLKDATDDVVLPIKIKKIVVREGEVLFGERRFNLALDEIGSEVTVKVPVTYELDELEEEKRLSYKIDYEYKKKVKDQRQPNGTYTYKEELVRDDYETRFRTKIFLVRTG